MFISLELLTQRSVAITPPQSLSIARPCKRKTIPTFANCSELSCLSRVVGREALSELRRAEQGGEQDDLVILRIGSLLDALDQPHQARLEYQRFILSPLCTQPVPDWRCETARTLLRKTAGISFGGLAKLRIRVEES